MYVLFVVLNKIDYLDDVLARLVKTGVRGATIVDSKGMAGAIVHGQMENIPLFGAFKMFADGAHPYNNTIFSVIKEELINDVTCAVQDVLKDIPHPGAGFMFTVKAENIYDLGSKKNKH